jgi:hypothetical protein
MIAESEGRWRGGEGGTEKEKKRNREGGDYGYISMDTSEEQADGLVNVVSPFAKVEGLAPLVPEGSRRRAFYSWVIGGAIVLIIAGTFAGWLIMRYLRDPLRTMEEFPIPKYLDSYKGLEGSRFKGDLRVEADLGWKDGVGRLMLFIDSEDDRPVAIMIPAGVAGGTFFEKGQTYRMALEVKEGGLIYADTCTKE